MKPDDILDAIGNVDDVYIKKAKEKKKAHKVMWIAISTIAACLALFVVSPMLLFFGGFGATAPKDSVGNEMKAEWGDVWIYYVDGSKISCEQEYMQLPPKEIFAVWKEKNGIGDEVVLISVEADSVYNIAISKNIENYYDIINSELLLESLERTMTGYLDTEYAEYNLILE